MQMLAAISVDDLHQLLARAGFGDVQVETVALDCIWRSADDAVAAIGGTPFGPLLAEAPSDQRESVLTTFRRRLGAKATGALTVRTASNIAQGTKTQATP